MTENKTIFFFHIIIKVWNKDSFIKLIANERMLFYWRWKERWLIPIQSNWKMSFSRLLWFMRGNHCITKLVNSKVSEYKINWLRVNTFVEMNTKREYILVNMVWFTGNFSHKTIDSYSIIFVVIRLYGEQRNQKSIGWCWQSSCKHASRSKTNNSRSHLFSCVLLLLLMVYYFVFLSVMHVVFWLINKKQKKIMRWIE